MVRIIENTVKYYYCKNFVYHTDRVVRQKITNTKPNELRYPILTAVQFYDEGTILATRLNTFLSHQRRRQNCIQHISKTHYDFKYATCFAKDLIHTINLRHWKYWKSKDIPSQNIISILWSPQWESHQLKCVKQSKKLILGFSLFLIDIQQHGFSLGKLIVLKL